MAYKKILVFLDQNFFQKIEGMGYIKFYVDSFLCNFISSKSNKSLCSDQILDKDCLVHCLVQVLNVLNSSPEFLCFVCAIPSIF